jgi:peroxiredoxin
MGRSKRRTIESGQQAPPFELVDTEGKRFALAAALERGPVVAAFFKVSCPVCQFAFPFLERLFKSYGGARGGGRVSFVAISQDDEADTKEFCEEYGITFPALLDEEGFPASNEYGLTNVPTYYLIAPDGKVQVESVGFSKRAFEAISAYLARFLGMAASSVFLPGEIVPESKPG